MKIMKDYSIRKSETSTVGEAFNELLNTYRLKDKFNEANLINSWGRLMGPAIANRTSEIYIYRKKLYLKLNSAPLKHELSYQKNKLLELLKKEYGDQVIEDIVIK